MNFGAKNIALIDIINKQLRKVFNESMETSTEDEITRAYYDRIKYPQNTYEIYGKKTIKNAGYTATWHEEITAEEGSHVVARKGSVIHAKKGSKVLADAGSIVWAYDGSKVTAAPFSRVMAYKGSEIKAYAGSTINNYEGSKVTRMEESSAMSTENKAMFEPGDHSDMFQNDGHIIPSMYAGIAENNKIEEMLGMSFSAEERADKRQEFEQNGEQHIEEEHEEKKEAELKYYKSATIYLADDKVPGYQSLTETSTDGRPIVYFVEEAFGPIESYMVCAGILGKDGITLENGGEYEDDWYSNKEVALSRCKEYAEGKLDENVDEVMGLSFSAERRAGRRGRFTGGDRHHSPQAPQSQAALKESLEAERDAILKLLGENDTNWYVDDKDQIQIDKPETKKYYYSWHFERGYFAAWVEDANENTVWSVHYPDDIEDEEGNVVGSTIFEDGFMKNAEDISGLEKYLKSLNIMPADSTLVSSEDLNEELLNQLEEMMGLSFSMERRARRRQRYSKGNRNHMPQAPYAPHSTSYIIKENKINSLLAEKESILKQLKENNSEGTEYKPGDFVFAKIYKDPNEKKPFIVSHWSHDKYYILGDGSHYVGTDKLEPATEADFDAYYGKGEGEKNKKALLGDNIPTTKIPVKEITIFWKEGKQNGMVKFPKTYKNPQYAWRDAHADLSYDVPKAGEGYDKAKFMVTWQDGDTYEGRLDLSQKEDNPATTTNVIGWHIYNYLTWLSTNERSPETPESKENIKNWLKKYDLGLDR